MNHLSPSKQQIVNYLWFRINKYHKQFEEREDYITLLASRRVRRPLKRLPKLPKGRAS